MQFFNHCRILDTKPNENEYSLNNFVNRHLHSNILTRHSHSETTLTFRDMHTLEQKP